MRIVGIITGILGSVALFGGGLFILLLGGVGQGLGAITDDAQYAQEFEQVGMRGIYAILISIVALVGACLSIAKPKIAAAIMLVSALIALVAIYGAAILGSILLAVGSLFAFLGRNESKN
tara:strand:+ start:854 stop:1213 length:360 start_codon:yes stop_codon:yes gene_type:complete